ncbi:glycerophosphodiester phosphodiesterase family protein [Photobacterium sp. ZSDE20]|uniref:Glycerophosphodiester phosphodiesterase family protein n=1 Tax=Photobacterium pectinilyticum TaxID=2906793 RepID=A0ABT1N811_9GAMM|nr:glycerophosphodiester phosphodiesterase family protein [Photobacterium sp. ZSDE20]MCQ1060885.1 glycerophosphodiester phosphodiesterase family protein [Photobacterium sp. ZSDE20]MDD1828719.1 glycerophosphodiester phosphodiesterase family protein [Photobacterium sp. ZSDE20]
MNKKLLVTAIALLTLAGCNSSSNDTAGKELTPDRPIPDLTPPKPSPSLNRVEQMLHRLENANENRDHVFVIGHRALWTNQGESLFPEQSLESIQYAIDMGVDVVELDIRVTADDQYVILHDGSLNRITNCDGSISQKLWEEVEDCQLIDGNGNITDETIPTLESVYELTKDKILINLDNKVGNSRYPDMFNMAIAFGVDHQILASVRMANESGRQSGYALIDEWRDSKIKFMPNIYDSDADYSDDTNYTYLEEILERVNPVLVQVRNAYNSSQPITMTGGFFFTDESLALRDKYNTHYWINTLYDSNNGLRSGGRGDEMAFRDGLPDEVWGWWHRKGATMFQTDEPIMATEFLEEKGYRQPFIGE